MLILVLSIRDNSLLARFVGRCVPERKMRIRPANLAATNTKKYARCVKLYNLGVFEIVPRQTLVAGPAHSATGGYGLPDCKPAAANSGFYGALR